MGKCLTTTQKENANVQPRQDDSDDDHQTFIPPSPPKESNFDSKSVPDKYYLIQILRAEDVPKMDMASDSDPYVILRIMDDDNKQKGKQIRSLYRLDNHNPIWNCYRTFSASPMHDTLKFELWD
eukprot:395878_1